jgi:predicted amidohydrolase
LADIRMINDSATDSGADRTRVHHHRQMTMRVACGQVPLAIGDTAGNRVTCRVAVETAARAGAQIVVLPELASSGYVFADRAELSSLAEARDGPAISEWADLAKAFGLTIVAGFPEAAGDAIYNSAAVVDPAGLRGVYRKAHLWDSENAVFDRGDDLPMVVDTEHGRIGVMICYDIEFPEWVRAVALSGADLLCAPVNWPLLPRPEGERPTEMVRALAGAGMNRMAMAVCDRVGTERDQDWIGGSVIIDADGYPMATATFGKAGVVSVDVDLAQSRLKRINTHNDVLEDRRTDLYRRTALLD